LQTIDYEHIPFRCRKCHEHGHLFRECPLNATNKEGNSDADKDKDGFAHTPGKRRQGGRKKATQASKDPSTNNKYAVLQDQPENPSDPKEVQTEKIPQQTGKGKEGSMPEMNPNISSTDPTTRIEDHLETTGWGCRDGPR
jgi:hypothetical protein